MSRFIQLHLLTAYPPSNLNRDDLGRPKTAIVGGSTRLRISSQSLKRAWRTSDVFDSALSGFKGTRTKRIGVGVYEQLISGGCTEKQAMDWAVEIAGVFGKVKAGKPGTSKKKEAKDPRPEEKKPAVSGPVIEQLAHISPEEHHLVTALTETLIAEKRAPEKHELSLLRANPKAADVAMFGRMLASATAFNVEAAVQVAHAISVNAVAIEDDFFTAVDDLNDGSEDAGAGHIGDAGFGAGVFYLYVCIDRDLLRDNLQDDAELADKSVQALVESAAKISPTGKQNSFASRAYTSYMLLEKGDQQPRSLAVAFYKAQKHTDPVSAAIQQLENQRDSFEKVYGACADAHCSFNAVEGVGTFESALAFVVG